MPACVSRLVEEAGGWMPMARCQKPLPRDGRTIQELEFRGLPGRRGAEESKQVLISRNSYQKQLRQKSTYPELIKHINSG